MGMHHLTVVRDFGTYAKGDHIEDEAEIARILKGEMRHHVVKVIADEKPKAAAPVVEQRAPEPEKSVAESVIFKS
jgi:hypothetical protein